MYREAQRQCVVALLVDGLERLAAEQRPPQKLLMQWIGQMQIVEGSYALQCSRARELTALFAAKGYRSCVLIGPSFAVFFYCSYLFTLIIIYYICSLKNCCL